MLDHTSVQRIATVVILLLALGLTTCTRDRTGPVALVPTRLSLNSGNNQTGTAGSQLAQPFVASVATADGEPVPGVKVVWSVKAGGGTLSSQQVSTDAQGHAAAVLTLGVTAGVNNDSVQATAAGLSGSPLVYTASTTAGPPHALAFVQAPSPAAAGTPITPAVRVSVEDAFSNVVLQSGVGIDVALGANPGGATLLGQTHGATVDGIATFSDLTLDKASPGYTLVASAAGLPTVTSPSFGIVPAGGPHLVFTALGNTELAAIPFTPALQVTAEDSLGNILTSFTGPVTVAIAANASGATLGGTTTVTAVAGVATFANIWIDKTGSGYTLSATATGMAPGVSAAFNISPGDPGPLTFTTQPTNATQNGVITPPVVVTALDFVGNPMTTFAGAVTLAIGTNPSAGTLSGTKTVTATAGVATFADLAIDKPGTGYTLTASSPGIAGGTSVPFQIIAASQATHFVFSAQPSSVAAGAPIAPAIVVTATDPQGGTVATFNGTVSLALASNPGSATLSGTMSVTAVSGVATFSSVRLDKVGTGYTLSATSPGVTSGTSNAFAVSAGAAARIVITTGNQQTAPAGTPLPLAYGVRVSDGFGNHVPGATVIWTVGAGGGSVASGQQATDTAGLASTQRTLGAHAGAQTVVATVSGLADSAATFVATATPNGTIGGTITLVSGFLAPPASLRASWSPSAAVPAPIPEYTPNELIVTYRADALAAPPVGSPALAAPATAAALGASIRARLAASGVAPSYEVRGISPAVLAARLRVRDSTQLDQVAAALSQDPAVQSVERNGIVHLESHHSAIAAALASLAAAPVVPSDPLYPWQAWHYGMIDLPRAWPITTGSASVLVAVVDNGIRYDHPAVAANLTHDGYDFVSDVSVAVCSGGKISNTGDGDGYDADPTIPADYDYDSKKNCVNGLTTSGAHGLHVAGTIGAVGNDGVGVTGVNWTVSIRPVRVLGVSGSGSFYDIAQGILYAAGLPADNGNGGTVKAPSGARIINMSLGGPSGNTTLHNAVIAATNAGALIVASAGNDGSTTALYPAAYPEALAVSAVGPSGLLASYSTHGSAIDIAAPGGDITAGGGTYGVTSSVWNFVSSAPAYDSWDGTSMAAPHVSGVAALLLAQTPSLTVAQLRSRLTTWAVDAGAVGPDNVYGAGIVNARNSLTQSLAPPAQLYALLYDATTGKLVATVPTTNGAYSFTALGDGTYWVYGAADENGDGVIAVAGRPWGTLGNSATPATVTVNGAGSYPASFTIAQPVEHEPNDVIAQANTLTMPGTMNGSLSTASDVDIVRVQIAQAGTYAFETSAQNGACGFALEANTELTLENGTGGTIATNDDINAGVLNYCSRITASLAPGTYYVAVSGWTAGRYRLTARVGP